MAGTLSQILIEGCRIDYLKKNSDKNIVIEVLGLEIDGHMHPLQKIDDCSCIRHIHSNKGPVWYEISTNWVELC